MLWYINDLKNSSYLKKKKDISTYNPHPGSSLPSFFLKVFSLNYPKYWISIADEISGCKKDTNQHVFCAVSQAQQRTQKDATPASFLELTSANGQKKNSSDNGACATYRICLLPCDSFLFFCFQLFV